MNFVWFVVFVQWKWIKHFSFHKVLFTNELSNARAPCVVSNWHLTSKEGNTLQLLPLRQYFFFLFLTFSFIPKHARACNKHSLVSKLISRQMKFIKSGAIKLRNICAILNEMQPNVKQPFKNHELSLKLVQVVCNVTRLKKVMNSKMQFYSIITVIYLLYQPNRDKTAGSFDFIWSAECYKRGKIKPLQQYSENQSFRFDFCFIAQLLDCCYTYTPEPNMYPNNFWYN